MCVVWCASRTSARSPMRRIQSSESFAASRNPRARSMRVSIAVIAFDTVKRGAKDIGAMLAARQARGNAAGHARRAASAMNELPWGSGSRALADVFRRSRSAPRARHATRKHANQLLCPRMIRRVAQRLLEKQAGILHLALSRAQSAELRKRIRVVWIAAHRQGEQWLGLFQSPHADVQTT